jgi:hypothetical protein
VLLTQQLLFCAQLFGMAFMDRTYQQVTRTQDFPHLYSAFKTKDGKYQTRENRIFGKYKLGGGIIIGVKNIITYFL